MDSYERARALLDAVIAAYSGRIGAAPSPQAARALRAERAPLLVERDALLPTAGSGSRRSSETCPHSSLRYARATPVSDAPTTKQEA